MGESVAGQADGTEQSLYPVRDFPVSIRFTGNIPKNQGQIEKFPISKISRDL